VSQPEPTDPKQLRRAFGTFATGVTVLTVGGAQPHGMTANSFASVSLDPPLVLVCVDHSAVMHASLTEAGSFGVSVLAGDQEKAARHFADPWRPLGPAQFDPVDWQPGRLTGAPLLVGAIARFECALWRSYEGGDHTIFIGELLSVDWVAEQDGLLFFRGQFGQISPQRNEVST
jgi:flavin reductase (DIM6/NTAB) family NADH-FMN oxidoreductase RutF